MTNSDMRQSLIAKIEDIADVLAKDNYPSDEMLVGRAGYLSGVMWISGDLGVYVTQMTIPDMRQSLIAKIEDLADVLARDDYPSDEILVGRAGYLSGVMWIR
ncbi:unnamed protein product [Cylicostephanus goldi]|uniref:Uncharacterized protein n=1 Tax=Cylicostephanus goldi TaxID=71465 RepID=A0A3P7R5Z0_CYLGO|nr:unnamed protein product [Cylicostephanus goldi]